MYDLDSNPVDARGRTSYLERFIHGAIYQARPDVRAVVHSQSPAVLPFADTGVPLRPMNHVAGFLGSGVRVFEIRTAASEPTDMLIRNAALGQALAAAQSVRHVVFRAVYTEVNARVEADALRLGTPTYLNAEEARLAMRTNDALVDRPWALWRQKAMGK